MISRIANPLLDVLRARYPVITITGPRQSGKTTLARAFWLYLVQARCMLAILSTYEENKREAQPAR